MTNTMTFVTDPLAGGLAEIRETLAELNGHRSSWEHDFAALFDDFDAMAVQLALEAAREATREAEAAGLPEDAWLELAGQQEQLAKRQESTTLELSSMRGLIEQQTELLTAFIGVASQFAAPGQPVPSNRGSSSVAPEIQAELALLNQNSPSQSRTKSGRSQPN